MSSPRFAAAGKPLSQSLRSTPTLIPKIPLFSQGESATATSTVADSAGLYFSPALDARETTTDLASAQFGQILQGGNPRDIQFRLRLVF